MVVYTKCRKIDSQLLNADCVEITRQSFDFHFAIFRSWTYELTGSLGTSYDGKPISSRSVLPGTDLYELITEISKGNSFSGERSIWFASLGGQAMTVFMYDILLKLVTELTISLVSLKFCNTAMNQGAKNSLVMSKSMKNTFPTRTIRARAKTV